MIPITQTDTDVVKDLVLQFLASYGGIVAGVAFLVSGLKKFVPNFASGREPILAIGLTFVLGVVAKLVISGVYGGSDGKSWGLHVVILIFAAVGAQTFHDKFMNPMLGKGGVPPYPAVPAQAMKPDDPTTNQKEGGQNP